MYKQNGWATILGTRVYLVDGYVMKGEVYGEEVYPYKYTNGKKWRRVPGVLADTFYRGYKNGWYDLK